ncbi:MAG: DUF4906 domain-containing protein, partial [Alistipes sp.]|nr:DUF4906 domain-containing protein [Alistipes sp.]
MELKKIMGKAVLLCAVALAVVACGQEEFDEVVCPETGKATLRFSAVEFTGESLLTTRAAALKTGESTIKGVWVAQFASGKIIKGPNYYSTIGAGNSVEAELDTETSNVWAVANVPSDLFSSFDQKNGTEADFKAKTLAYTAEIKCDGTSNFLPMVGMKAITASDTQITVPMTRAVARIDFTVTHDATVTNLKLTECYLTYVPNNSILEAKTAGAARVYPTAAAAQFFGSTAANDKDKFVYGKRTISVSAKGQSATATWYVPENLAGRNTAITAAKFKGDKTAPDKFATRIIVKGTCTYKGTPDTEVSFTIYPGQNATTDFNIQRNYVYTVSSTIKGLNVTDNRVTVHDFVDLSADGTANCYMIHEAGKYKFKCNVAGNGKIYRTNVLTGGTLIATDFSSAAISGNTAEILWQGSGNSYATGNATTSVIKNVAIDGDYITFETAATFAEGNALVALKNNGTVVWSWHIWATNYKPEDNNSNVDTYTLNGTYATKTTEFVMRCNLGATGQTATGMAAETTAPQCYGLKYQWGRKDPFWHGASGWANGATANISAKGNSNMVSTAIKNPTQFYINYDTSNYDWIGANAQKNNYLWGNGDMTATNISIVHGASGTTTRVVNKQRGFKSAFDPCPVGWRVPPQALWTNCGITSVANNYVAASGSVPAYLKLLSNVGRNPVKYPAAGYLNNSTGAVTAVAANGYYWSSSPCSSEVYAGNLRFSSGGVCPVNYSTRAGGFSVRCVRE